ncbi:MULTISPECIES: hypothetical protein [unclassified Sinorhizobium]|uniref:hypothetical protein n=1 Tax=unclassified Sinorhizobium TaxID=2613772 RepID=UPI003526065C
MAKGGLPVVLVDNGVPAMIAKIGLPITIVGSSGGSTAVVSDGATVPLKGPDQTQTFGNVTAKVSNGAVTGVTLPTGSAIVTNQAGGVLVNDADGTSVNCTATIVPATGQLSYVGVPGTAALVTNGMSVKMANNGGAGPVDGTVAITGGFITSVNLALATNTIVANSFTTSISGFAVSGSTDFATMNISAGALQSVGVSLAPTKTVVTNGQALTVPVTGTYTTTATLTVSGGAVTAIVLS